MQVFVLFASNLFSRYHRPCAALLAVLSFVLLWTGLGISEDLPLSREAIAESSLAGYDGGQLAEVPREQTILLQSTVDSLVLTLRGVFSASPFLPDDTKSRNRQEVLATILNSLTFTLGGEAYFTAWQGTHAVHSPLSPDATSMDFVDAVDADGNAFVQHMERIAYGGRGFLRARLPRQLAERPNRTNHFKVERGVPEMNGQGDRDGAMLLQRQVVLGAITENTEDTAKIRRFSVHACPLENAVCAPQPVIPAVSAEPVEQLVYVRRIPDTDWHIAAFLPIDKLPADQGFSSVWPLDMTAQKHLAAEAVFRKGLCVSGMSLAGLAGLMLIPGRNREEESGSGTEKGRQKKRACDENRSDNAGTQSDS